MNTIQKYEIGKESGHYPSFFDNIKQIAYIVYNIKLSFMKISHKRC